MREEEGMEGDNGGRDGESFWKGGGKSLVLHVLQA